MQCFLRGNMGPSKALHSMELCVMGVLSSLYSVPVVLPFLLKSETRAHEKRCNTKPQVFGPEMRTFFL